MIVQLTNVEKGEFKVTTESYSEFLKYHSMAIGKKEIVAEVKPKQRYKKQAMKACTLCGKKFKGNVGVALHRVRTHEHRNWNKDGSPKQLVSNFIPVKQVV